MSIDSDKRTTSEATLRVTGAAAVLADLTAWKDEVQRTNAACAALGLAAAMVSITVRDPDGRGVDAVRRAALATLAGELRPSDAVGMLADDELGVVLAPVADVHDATARVTRLDHVLRDAGVAVAIGWAMRTSDLFSAMARADAAVASAVRAKRTIASGD